MIVSFRCSETEKVFRRENSRKFRNIQRVAFRRLIALDSARRLSDPGGVGLSLKALKRDRKGRHSIRINDQFRVCFEWSDGNAAHVEIVDYH
ncbi:MAG TPA: type II toxin-antitoxin system RelE/ParE family toxin [Bryobacteraceae bacterium]|jgi:proteic killer suppression protein|nr:type II toxin-antitoxin system RelE/ParE family toxin [Bryobacteraceae bacterium]